MTVKSPQSSIKASIAASCSRAAAAARSARAISAEISVPGRPSAAIWPASRITSFGRFRQLPQRAIAVKALDGREKSVSRQSHVFVYVGRLGCSRVSDFSFSPSSQSQNARATVPRGQSAVPLKRGDPLVIRSNVLSRSATAAATRSMTLSPHLRSDFHRTCLAYTSGADFAQNVQRILKSFSEPRADQRTVAQFGQARLHNQERRAGSRYRPWRRNAAQSVRASACRTSCRDGRDASPA